VEYNWVDSDSHFNCPDAISRLVVGQIQNDFTGSFFIDSQNERLTGFPTTAPKTF
jgi:hypothetical protein